MLPWQELNSECRSKWGETQRNAAKLSYRQRSVYLVSTTGTFGLEFLSAESNGEEERSFELYEGRSKLLRFIDLIQK